MKICKAEVLLVWEGFDFTCDVLSFEILDIGSIFFNDTDILMDIHRLGYAGDPINIDKMYNMIYYYYVNMDSKILPSNMQSIVEYIKMYKRDEIINNLL